jgi:C-terminal duplication domain of Friend of PRMT1
MHSNDYLCRVEQVGRAPRRGFGQNRFASRAFQAASLGRSGGDRNNRQRGNNRPARAPPRTKEQLDAELDTMMAH